LLIGDSLGKPDAEGRIEQGQGSLHPLVRARGQGIFDLLQDEKLFGSP
jgi:hypothetical protein